MKTNQKQSIYHFSFTISINNSKSKVWETLIDVESWKVWDTELKSAQLNGEFKVGAKGILIPNKGPKLNFYISEIIRINRNRLCIPEQERHASKKHKYR